MFLGAAIKENDVELTTGKQSFQHLKGTSSVLAATPWQPRGVP